MSRPPAQNARARVAEPPRDEQAPPGATRGCGCRTGCGPPLPVRRRAGGEPARGIASPAQVAQAEEGGARQHSTRPGIACQCPRRPSRHPRTACGWPAGAAVIALCACAHLVAHLCVSPWLPALPEADWRGERRRLAASSSWPNASASSARARRRLPLQHQSQMTTSRR